ncbi:hypothetical protein [Streptomyces sp. NPDC088358]|uniref:hypothetical protein n=1 Tax=Streptomyces sp. NPDC088358 TaxID=3365857 RepID=UPI003826C0D7
MRGYVRRLPRLCFVPAGLLFFRFLRVFLGRAVLLLGFPEDLLARSGDGGEGGLGGFLLDLFEDAGVDVTGHLDRQVAELLLDDLDVDAGEESEFNADPGEHGADQFFVVDVAVGHVGHGLVDAGQALHQDLGGLLDLVDVGAVCLVKVRALVIVAPGRAGFGQRGLQLGERVSEIDALMVEVGCGRLDVGDLDVEYLALVAHDLASARSYDVSRRLRFANVCDAKAR